jgi:hypothetical protein
MKNIKHIFLLPVFSGSLLCQGFVVLQEENIDAELSK